MKWDWGQPFGAKRGEYPVVGKWISFSWLVLGSVSLLLAIEGESHRTLWALLGGGWILLGLIGLGMAAGVIPRRDRG